MKLVIASRNPKKVGELSSLLSPLGWEILPLPPHLPVPPEEASTFLENALIKARAASQALGLPALADDSGLCVPALGGAPGVRSARYAAEGATDAQNRQKLLCALEGKEDRRAYFYAALVLLFGAEDPTPIVAEGFWHGEIALAEEGERGFGYDPLFFDSQARKTAAHMQPQEKNKRSHRGKAARRLLARLSALGDKPG